MIGNTFFALLLILSAGISIELGRQRGPRERLSVDKLAPPPMSQWSPRAVSIASLGHRGLYEDFSVIWLLQLLAEPDIKAIGKPEQIYQAIIPVLRQTPKIESIYLLSCTVLAIDLKEPKYCEEITLLGLKAFPESTYIPMTQGFVFSFLLNQRAKAAPYYGLAASRPNAKDYVKRIALKFAQEAGSNINDLNDSMELLKDMPGGTKLLEMMRPVLEGQLVLPELAPHGSSTTHQTTGQSDTDLRSKDEKSSDPNHENSNLKTEHPSELTP
ncbi:MAG: hypothetical protein NTV34_17280 [Proteobacteria bacterium]|nr:hypothetical protein [Pseudomonadota bacterium]